MESAFPIPTGVHTCELLLALSLSLSVSVPRVFWPQSRHSSGPREGRREASGTNKQVHQLECLVERHSQLPHRSVAPGKGFLVTLMMDSSGAYSGGLSGQSRRGTRYPHAHEASTEAPDRVGSLTLALSLSPHSVKVQLPTKKELRVGAEQSEQRAWDEEQISMYHPSSTLLPFP